REVTNRAVVAAVAGWIVFAQVLTTHAQSAGAKRSDATASVPSHAEERSLLERYCVRCHNERLKTAGLMLDRLDPGDVRAHPDVWEKVVHKLLAGDMPPAGLPRPDRGTYDSLRESLERSLNLAAESAPNPGRPLLHRLNRTEYGNVIRDLL